MSLVKISDLKNRLSHHLRQVRAGQSVLVCDRNRVIARIDPAGDIPADAGEDRHWLEDLERRGVIRRGTGRLRKGWLARRPKPKASLLAAVLAERQESR